MINNNNKQLGYYLAGLIEGNGGIWIPKMLEKSKRNYTYHPNFYLSFHSNNVVFVEHLKKVLGTGSVSLDKRCNACKYTIYGKDALIKLINLINGKFRTPKIWYLNRAIDRINLLYNTNINKLPLDESDLGNNPWLAGFIDADGHFMIALEGIYGLNNSQARGRVKCIFSITQREIDRVTGLSLFPIMNKIADYFQSNVNYWADNKITVVVGANSKHYLTKEYFDKYPLMSSKWLNYLCYIEGLNFLGKHLTKQEILDVQKLKNSMNNKRKYYDWNHLDNFYTI